MQEANALGSNLDSRDIPKWLAAFGTDILPPKAYHFDGGYQLARISSYSFLSLPQSSFFLKT
jgi:hypothetical protein